MAPRSTRASAAAAKSAITNQQQTSSPPEASAPTTQRQSRRQKQASPHEAVGKTTETPATSPTKAVKTSASSRKRTRISNEDKVLVELPHGLGDIPTPDVSDEAANSKEEDPAPPKKRARRSTKSAKVKDATNEEKVLDELPHGLGDIPTPDASDEASKVKDEDVALPKQRGRRAKGSPKVKAEEEETQDLAEKARVASSKDETPNLSKKRARRSPKSAKVKADEEEIEGLAEKADAVSPSDDPVKSGNATKADKTKKAKYGFMPGQSPYPDYPHPTPEECYEVDRILSKAHGKVKAPEVIPVPSVEVAGCGEVPSVLDALIRTRLSAATTGTNSSRAFQGLVKTFGTIKEGIGKGSVDWNAVRLAPQPKVFEAIKSGGLAQVKSKDIKLILDMTYKENQARKDAIKEEADDDAAPGPAGTENEPIEEKNSEIARAEADVLSLDHFHLLETQDALDRMCEFPGIGPKTAACVALFCLRRSCFAVDTHVFRLCQYLGWIPPADQVKAGQPKVSRNTAYYHCEALVPDDLKYSLHQLLIKHGKVCPRCRAATTTGSEAWEEGCPIEHLVKRHEAKKGGAVVPKKSGAKAAKDTPQKANAKTAKATPKKTGGKKGKKVEESEEDASSGLSDLDSEAGEMSDLVSDREEVSSEPSDLEDEAE